MLASQSLALAFEGLLRRLLSTFDTDAPKARAVLVRAVSDIVRAHPPMMAHAAIGVAVGDALADSSRLVRAEALDLVGAFASTSPALVAQFFDLLLAKLGDEGVSVRKKVVGILRDLLLARRGLLDGSGEVTLSSVTGKLHAPESIGSAVVTYGSGSRAVRAIRALLFRAAEPAEEESVRDAVASVIDALWFAPPVTTLTPSATGVSDSRNASAAGRGSALQAPNATTCIAGGDVVATELRMRTHQLVAVVCEKPRGAVGPLGSGAEWLSDMLTRLLNSSVPASGTDASAADAVPGAAPRQRSRRDAAAAAAASALRVPGFGAWTPLNVCSALIASLVEALDALGERRAALVSARARVDDAIRTDDVVPTAPMTPDVAPSPTRSSVTAAQTAVERELVASCALYERELLAVTTCMYAFAAAAPQLVAAHVSVIAPMLRGDALLLSPRGNDALLVRAAGLIELVLPLGTRQLAPRAVGVIERDLIALVEGSLSSPAVVRAAAATAGVLVAACSMDDQAVRALATRMYKALRIVKERSPSSAPNGGGSGDAVSVRWLASLTPTVATASGDRAPNPMHREVLHALWTLGVLGKYVDLDGVATAASESVTASRLGENEVIEVSSAAATSDASAEKRPRTGRGRTSDSKPKQTVAPSPNAATGVVLGDDASLLPRGATMVALHSVCGEYAGAGIELSRAALLQARRVLMSMPHAAPSPAAAGASDAARRRATDVIRGYEAVAAKALRALGFLASREPTQLLTPSTAAAIDSCLEHPLPALREAALITLRELLSGTCVGERAAVAAALAQRARADAALVATMRASGHEPSAALLASAGGQAARAVLGYGAAAAGAAISTVRPDAPPPLPRDAGASAPQSPAGRHGSRLLEAGSSAFADVDGAAYSVVVGAVQGRFRAIVRLLSDPGSADDALLGEDNSGSRVRLAATQLFTLMIEQRVVDPEACVPHLIALTTDDEEPIAALAHKALEVLIEKAPGRFEAHAIGGVTESFYFQLDVLGGPVERVAFVTPGTDRISRGRVGASDALAEPRPVAPLDRFYATCMCHTPRARYAFLRAIVQRVVPDTLPAGAILLHAARGNIMNGAVSEVAAAAVNSAGALLAAGSGKRRFAAGGGSSQDVSPVVDLGLARYLTRTLMLLPYSREEEPLTVLACINRAVVVHAHELAAALRVTASIGDDELAGAQAVAGDAAAVAAAVGTRSMDSANGGATPPRQSNDFVEDLTGSLTTKGAAESAAAVAAPAMLPARGTAAYVRLAAHAGYAWSLVGLLTAKRYLKAAYDIRDARMREFDPAASSTGRGADRAVTADPDVAASDLAELDTPPAGLEEALLAARDPPGAAAETVLARDMIRATVAALEVALSSSTDESGGRLHATSKAQANQHRRASKAASIAATAAAAAAADGDTTTVASQPPSSSKKKRGGGKRGGNGAAKRLRQRGGSDDDDGSENYSDAYEAKREARRTPRAPRAARAKAVAVLAASTAASDMDGSE